MTTGGLTTGDGRTGSSKIGAAKSDAAKTAAVKIQTVTTSAVSPGSVKSTTRPVKSTTRPDHRKLPRRRGAALNSAIFEAVLAEIAESGYSALTMDRVADRARASKASLYRRWPGRAALVLDAAYDSMPGPDAVPDTGSLRLDILTVMRQGARQMEGIVGQAMRGVLGDALQNPEAAAEVREFGRKNAIRMMREIVANAVNRGECDPALVTDIRIEAGPALLRQRFLFTDGPIGDDFLVGVVDEVVLPLFGVKDGDNHTG